MMNTARYIVVRDISPTKEPLQNQERHPECPRHGFATATEAGLWADTHNLDWRWYITPIYGEMPND